MPKVQVWSKHVTPAHRFWLSGSVEDPCKSLYTTRETATDYTLDELARLVDRFGRDWEFISEGDRLPVPAVPEEVQTLRKEVAELRVQARRAERAMYIVAHAAGGVISVPEDKVQEPEGPAVSYGYFADSRAFVVAVK